MTLQFDSILPLVGHRSSVGFWVLGVAWPWHWQCNSCAESFSTKCNGRFTRSYLVTWSIKILRHLSFPRFRNKAEPCLGLTSYKPIPSPSFLFINNNNIKVHQPNQSVIIITNIDHNPRSCQPIETAPRMAICLYPPRSFYRSKKHLAKLL